MLKYAKLILRYSCFVLVFFAAVLAQRIEVPRPPMRFLKPPKQIKNFTLGYNDMMASVLWLRALQNMDYCENGKFMEEDFVVPLADAKSKVQGIVQRKMKPSKCHLGWVYSMLDTISEIQPKFKLTYDVGAMFLSIAVDDREGARLIYEKGLKLYPNDWQMNFNAAYLYLWELQDANRAADLLRTSIQNGGPPLVSALAASIYSEGGQVHLAKTILYDALAKNPPPLVQEVIRKKIASIEKKGESP